MQPSGRKLYWIVPTLVLAANGGCSFGTDPLPVAPDGGIASQDGGPSAQGNEKGGGTVGISLTLPGGEHVSSLVYTLANGINTYADTVFVGDAGSRVQFVIGGVVAGAGYSLRLDLASDDGADRCIGTFGALNPYADPQPIGSFVGTTFRVTNRSTTTVNVNLICLATGPTPNGGVGINATSSCCPTWDTAIALPDTASITAPDNTIQVIGHASGPCDTATNPLLKCVWTLTSGTGTVGPTTRDRGNFVSTFACPAVAEVDTVTFSCTDGPLPEGGWCPNWSTTTTVQVTCQ